MQDKSIRWQRELFGRIENAFGRLVGSHHSLFSTSQELTDHLKREAEFVARRLEREFAVVARELFDFYQAEKTAAISDGRAIGGMKLVVGGSSRLTQTHLHGVRATLLYADTVLIPDPVLPWLETDRKEERFRHVLLLHAMLHLLQLKPLVDADLPTPPIHVFQSWEKSLESQDRFTEAGLGDFITTVVRQTLAIPEDQDIPTYAHSRADDFLQAVERTQLLVSPGAQPGESIQEALAAIRIDHNVWRAPDDQGSANPVSDVDLVLRTIAERIAPHFHLFENADILHAHPFIPIPAQAHYYQICSAALSKRLEIANVLGAESAAAIAALSHVQNSWLGDLPLEGLIEVRSVNEHETFRKKLNEYTSILHESDLGNLDRVASEVARAIAGLQATHKESIRKIRERYQSKHIPIGFAASASLALHLVPTLAPYLGPTVAPLVLGTMFAVNKWEERREVKEASRSLMGVLARGLIR